MPDDDDLFRTGYYILDAHGEPERCTDALKWGQWYHDDRSRIVAQDKDESTAGEVMVSTVFLGLDHSFGCGTKPILWETLVFGGVLDGEMDRYTSRQAALSGHQAMCERVKATVVRA